MPIGGVKLRIDTVTGLKAVQGWLRFLSQEERAAVFGAIQDEWCVKCGRPDHSGDCETFHRQQRIEKRMTSGENMALLACSTPSGKEGHGDS